MKWIIPIVVLIALCSVSANAAEVWSEKFAIAEMGIRGEGLVIEPYGYAASQCNGNKFRVFSGRAGQNASSIAGISRAITNAEELVMVAAMVEMAEGEEEFTLNDMAFYRVKYDDTDPRCYIRVFEVESVFNVWSVR